MAGKNKRIMIIILTAGIIVSADCLGANEVSNQPPATSVTAVQQTGNPAGAQPVNPSVPAAPANTQVASENTPGAQKPAEATSRVDVIYFHAAQRCVTCLCFEQHITSVMDKYFQDAINSGKLTYKVLNVAGSANEEIAKQYGAVGSQLFINVIIKGVDNISDIQDIWSWKCTGNPVSFERKVKTVVDQALLKVP
jgi:hypothetical protein